MTPQEPGTDQNGAPIVAELGRAETPAETATRKAEATRRHKQNQTTLNLVVALIASLAVVLITVLLVVRPDPAPAPAIDYATLASQIQPGYDAPILAPTLPEGWAANDARTETGADGVAAWYIGFLTPGNDFVAMLQGIDANPTWLSGQLRGARSTGSAEVGGLHWDVFDQRAAEKPGNLAYAMTTTVGANTVALYGTATVDEFHILAAAVAAQLEGK